MNKPDTCPSCGSNMIVGFASGDLEEGTEIFKECKCGRTQKEVIPNG